jgi:hypothetical protein
VFEGQDSCIGDDPRCFFYKGEPYAWSCHNIGGNDYKNKKFCYVYNITNCITKESFRLEIEREPSKGLGKNWMPICVADQLYFVVTIDPEVTLLKCNKIENGRAFCSWETPYELVEGGVGRFVSCFRGGTPLIYNEKYECFLGIGHYTHNTNFHTPFLYTLSKGLKRPKIHNCPKGLVLDVPEDTAKAQRLGLIQGDRWTRGIFDPLSIYEHEGNFYCCAWHCPSSTSRAAEGWGTLYKIIF